MGFELAVHRADAFMLKARKFHVEIDGVEVGALRTGAQLMTVLAEGEHRVRVFAGDAASKSATSKAVTVQAGPAGSASLVARPADVDPAARTERLARRDPVAIELVEGADVSRVGPTFMQIYRSRPPSFGNPARTPAQRTFRLLALALGVIGFVLLPLVRNGVGFLFLGAAVLISGWQWASYLRRRNRT